MLKAIQSNSPKCLLCFKWYYNDFFSMKSSSTGDKSLVFNESLIDQPERIAPNILTMVVMFASPLQLYD